MTLTEFLLARIAEDETYVRRDRFAPVDMTTKHIPMGAARLLAECEAKRRIIEDFEDLHRDYQQVHTDSLWARRFQATVAMAHLAAVYADHPDYNPDWKP